MIRTGQTHPGISDRDHKMVAEILACWTDEDNPDFVRQAEQRRRKLESFPEEDRPRIRRYVNAVLAARSEGV